MRTLIVMWMLVSVALAGQDRPLPNSEALLAAARENLSRAERDDHLYAFKERRTDLHTNPFGRLGTGGTRVLDVYPSATRQLTYRRIIERDGTLVLAQASGWAYGLESDDRVRARAVENASANRVAAEFGAHSWPEAIEDVAPRLVGRRPLVWIDTGRKELGARVVAAVQSLNPRRVALQGSNPPALARELARWMGAGWRFERMERWDVDPNSPFAEAVAVLVSPDPSPPERRSPRRKTVSAR